tara:strand:+ start:770 stop:988 length:219 start_codon:yes stop_codon:yes gene_type:complete
VRDTNKIATSIDITIGELTEDILFPNDGDDRANLSSFEEIIVSISYEWPPPASAGTIWLQLITHSARVMGLS